MKKAVLIALVVFTFGLTLAFLVEEPAPDFTVIDAYGQTFKLSDHRGEVVLVKFMFTTCPSCQQQTEILKAVRLDYGEGDLTIISLSVSPFDDSNALQAYSESNGAEWIFASDSEGIADDYDIRSVPHMVFIDRSGRIASSYVGVLDENGVSNRIDSAMTAIDPIIIVALSIVLIAAAVSILSYVGYTNRDTIRQRLLGNSEES